MTATQVASPRAGETDGGCIPAGPVDLSQSWYGTVSTEPRHQRATVSIRPRACDTEVKLEADKLGKRGKRNDG